MTQLLIPEISVIIPVKGASKTIAHCLDSLFLNKNVNFEVIVVDDGCSDRTIDIISKYNCAVLKNNTSSGVSGARNTGALASKGNVLLFIDSDIVVPEDALSKILERMQFGGVSVVMGMLADYNKFNNFSSQYKNLWMYYTFNNLPAEHNSLIFTSITAIKREVFLKCGGFDINYRYPNVEDNELGIRLSDAGYSIVLDKTLKVEHLKYYTFFSLLRTHYFRTKGLIKLYNRRRIIGLAKSNVPTLFILNIPLSVAVICLLLSLPLRNYFFPKIITTIFLFILLIFINYNWLFFLNRKRGVIFAVKSALYLPVEFIVIIFGLAVGQIEYFMSRRY